MYRQIDSVSMGSPLRPVLVNIFVGFHKKGLLSAPEKPEVYFHYVDDIFCLFSSEKEADLFFTSLKNIHHPLGLH